MRWIWIIIGGLGSRALLAFWWWSRPQFAESTGFGWAALGILLAPIATIAWFVVDQNVEGGIDGLWWGIVMLGVLLDLTVYGTGAGDSRLNRRYKTIK